MFRQILNQSKNYMAVRSVLHWDTNGLTSRMSHFSNILTRWPPSRRIEKENRYSTRSYLKKKYGFSFPELSECWQIEEILRFKWCLRPTPFRGFVVNSVVSRSHFCIKQKPVKIFKDLQKYLYKSPRNVTVIRDHGKKECKKGLAKVLNDDRSSRRQG